MAYSVGRAQMISSYLVLEAVILRRENCASACMNQILGFVGQNRGNRIAMAATLVPGSSVDMSVTLVGLVRKISSLVKISSESPIVVLIYKDLLTLTRRRQHNYSDV